MPELLELRSADAVAVIDLDHGGRLASLLVGGAEVLVGPADDPLHWGCYPMVPFAGRIRHGELDFDGLRHRLPVNLGPHAIHGYGFTSRWRRSADDEIEWSLQAPWPYRGRVRQRFLLGEGVLEMEMTVHAEDRQPLTLGWHPWFRRRVNGEDVELTFEARAMYELDDEAIPTGRLVPPSPRPWDNCFTELVAGPRLAWGSLGLDLRSSADHWIVFDEPEHAICVEPQTGPPNESNSSPRVLEPGESTRLQFTIDWRGMS